MNLICHSLIRFNLKLGQFFILWVLRKPTIINLKHCYVGLINLSLSLLLTHIKVTSAKHILYIGLKNTSVIDAQNCATTASLNTLSCCLHIYKQLHVSSPIPHSKYYLMSIKKALVYILAVNWQALQSSTSGTGYEHAVKIVSHLKIRLLSAMHITLCGISRLIYICHENI